MGGMIKNIDYLMNRAIESYQNSNFEEAIDNLQKLLEIQPKNFEALNFIGFLNALKGRPVDAKKYLMRALEENASDRLALINLAKAHFELNELTSSLVTIEKAIKIDSKNSEIYYLKAKCLCKLNEFENSIEYFRKALELKSNYPEVLLDLSNVLCELSRFDEALIQIDQAIKLKNDYLRAWFNKSAILHELKRYDEALYNLNRVIELDPLSHEAWEKKGNTLYELKSYNDAIAHYDKALSIKPDYAEGWVNKGNALHQLKRYNEAIAHYDKALSIKPDYAEGWVNKGNTFHEIKRYNEAIICLEKTLSLKPDIDWVSGDLLHVKMKICSWSDLPKSLESVSKKVLANERVAQPFLLLSLSDDAYLHKKSSEIYSQNKYPENLTLGPIPMHANKEKIRIAYFSPDFRSHPASFLTAELFEMHDRERFEVLAFSLKKAPSEDEMNMRLRKGFDQFIDVENMSDLDITLLARKWEVDIAIDLAGLTQYSRTGIFSYRAAPMQVNWLGYPGTLGADFIDYIVADKTIIPDSHQHFYTEKIVYLPDTYMVDDSKRIRSSRVYKREEFGLPKGDFIFCCFNNEYKFNAQVLDSWSRILLAVENSVFWIPENNEHFKTNITTEFERRGICSSRIIFSKRIELMADHLARYSLADIFLDTYPYNAHTTAVDSLKSGVPVITLIGQSFASRVAASLLNAIGMPELITISQNSYENLAIELAKNPQKLLEIKQKLLNNSFTTPLFDTPRFTKNLEAAYSKMYSNYQAGLQPNHIKI